MSLYIDIGAHNTKEPKSQTDHTTQTNSPSSPSIFSSIQRRITGQHAAQKESTPFTEHLDDVGSDIRTGFAAPATWIAIKLGLRHEHGGQEPSILPNPSKYRKTDSSSAKSAKQETNGDTVNLTTAVASSENPIISEADSSSCRRFQSRVSGRAEGIDQFGGEESEST